MRPIPGIFPMSYSFRRKECEQQEKRRRSLISVWVFQVFCPLCFRNYSTHKNSLFKTYWLLLSAGSCGGNSTKSGMKRFKGENLCNKCHLNGDEEFGEGIDQTPEGRALLKYTHMWISAAGGVKSTEVLACIFDAKDTEDPLGFNLRGVWAVPFLSKIVFPVFFCFLSSWSIFIHQDCWCFNSTSIYMA